MADRSGIEWTDASVNPIRARLMREVNGERVPVIDLETRKQVIGWHCEHVTTGCEVCYAEGINRRLGTGLPFKPGHRKDIEIFLDEKMLMAPLHWRKPRKIFVCSMTDLFADFVKDEWIDRIFAVAALCPQHTFQVLTKRAERMRQWFADVDRADKVGLAMLTLVDRIPHGHRRVPWPLPNVWLGVSAERQQEANERIPLLMQTPAAVRFLSLEPLLAPIDLMNVPHPLRAKGADWVRLDVLARHGIGQSGIHWVIDGGESGSDPRDYDIDASREIERQCVVAGVPYFRKQLGAKPFEREPSAWPNGHPHGNGRTELIGDGFGRYFVHGLKSSKGGDPAEWPADLRRREFPQVPA